jgi:glycosyltransferase involved in cell wall biosynthesis
MAETLPISVLLLVRDEAAALRALLPSLAFATEVVVVVDAATRDDSAAIAEAHGARTLSRTLDGFGPQRQFGLEQCRQPWVLWIDADERLAPEAPGVMATAISRGEADGWTLRRRTWFLGRPIRFCGWRNERVLRLFRRERARFDASLVHERVHVDGRVSDLGLTLEHLSYETWAEARRKLLQYSAANTEQLARAGRGASIADVILRPPLRFARMYVLQLGVLDGARGVLLCGLAATQVFLKYAGRWAAGRSGPRRT